MTKTLLGAALVAGAVFAVPAHAADALVSITKCPTSYGTIAVTDGDTQGWTKFGLGSPRDMLAAMIRESGCFTVHDASTGKPADYLMSAIAGSKEEVDQGINLAKGAATEAALRTGALGAIPGGAIGGAAVRMFAGFGGKKKTASAGLRVLSPATGMTLLAGSGESKKTQLSWGGVGDYGGSADGQMLTAAFVTAYNNIVAQAGALPKKP